MSVGTIFLLISFCLFFAAAVGIRAFPAIDTWAHAALALGLVLDRWALGGWWHRSP